MSNTSADHISYFDFAVGVIFDHLYRNFPIRQDISERLLRDSLGSILEVAVEGEEEFPGRIRTVGETYIKQSNIPLSTYLEEVVEWLVSEDFVRGGYVDGFQLSAKTLTVLKRLPEGVQEGLGNRLAGATQDFATDAGKSAVSEIVGQVIGAAARAMTN